MMRISTVFLDRDGTVNVRPVAGRRYILSCDEMQLIDGAGEAIRQLNESGIRAILVTNQQCVGRGLVSEAELEAIHSRLTTLLAASGARLDAIYVCSHLANECVCRKPLPGLLERARVDFPGLQFPQTLMVGDSETDVMAGKAVGSLTARILPYGDIDTSNADLRAPGLADIVHELTRSGMI